MRPIFSLYIGEQKFVFLAQPGEAPKHQPPPVGRIVPIAMPSLREGPAPSKTPDRPSDRAYFDSLTAAQKVGGEKVAKALGNLDQKKEISTDWRSVPIETAKKVVEASDRFLRSIGLNHQDLENIVGFTPVLASNIAADSALPNYDQRLQDAQTRKLAADIAKLQTQLGNVTADGNFGPKTMLALSEAPAMGKPEIATAWAHLADALGKSQSSKKVAYENLKPVLLARIEAQQKKPKSPITPATPALSEEARVAMEEYKALLGQIETQISLDLNEKQHATYTDSFGNTHSVEITVGRAGEPGQQEGDILVDFGGGQSHAFTAEEVAEAFKSKPKAAPVAVARPPASMEAGRTEIPAEVQRALDRLTPNEKFLIQQIDAYSSLTAGKETMQFSVPSAPGAAYEQHTVEWGKNDKTGERGYFISKAGDTARKFYSMAVINALLGRTT